MFALKRIQVVSTIASKFKCIRWNSVASNLLNINSHQLKDEHNEKYSYSYIKSVFPNMTQEIESGVSYMKVFPDMIRELTDYSDFTLQPNNYKEAEEHFIQMLDYTLSHGQRHYVTLITELYTNLMKPKGITSEVTKQGNILGWSIELILISYLLLDDIIDGSWKRRGKKCWYKVEGMEQTAINDMIILENSSYLVINRFFGHLPCYAGLMKTLTETYMVSMLGHMYETMYKRTGIDNFTMSDYDNVSNWKGAYFQFYQLPALPMVLAGYDLDKDRKFFDALRWITLEMGPYYQAQNDYYDCFQEDRLKKPGLDIQNGTISWFSAMVMEMGSEEQKNVLKKYYGIRDPDCVAKVKQVYRDLNLIELFDDYSKCKKKAVLGLVNELLHSDETLRNACYIFYEQGFNHIKFK